MLRHDDDDSFDALFARERLAMVRVAYLVTSSRAVAEEIAHDAFVEVYRRWDGLERPGAYLRTCVVNRAVRHKRRDGGRVVHLHESVDNQAGSPQEFDHTYMALSALAPKARAMVVLRYYAGLSQSEIAETLGVPVGTVKSGLHNALAELKKVLS